MTHLVLGAKNVRIVMADARGVGQGAYTPLANVVALALAVAPVAPQVPIEARFNVVAANCSSGSYAYEKQQCLCFLPLLSQVLRRTE